MPPNYMDCPPMPDSKTKRYVFLYKYEYDTDVNNMSRETHNEYVIVKYNCKGIEELSEDDLERETTIDRYLH
eukprot:12691961-Ditylum_brightwellii.AAC.1